MRDTPVIVVIEDDLSLSIVKKLVTEIECKYYIEKSRKKEMRKGILPKDETARIGPMYNQLLINFVQNHWDYNTAKLKSNSLNRFINKISN